MAIAALSAGVTLTAGANGARGGQAYTLTFVSTTAAQPGTPYGIATFEVERQPSKRTVSYRVQLVVHCDPAGYVGDWTYVGESRWISSSGDAVAIGGFYYPAAPCQAWVYEVSGPGGFLPDSNVVPFVGP